MCSARTLLLGISILSTAACGSTSGSSASSGSVGLVTYGAGRAVSTTAIVNEMGVSEASFTQPPAEVWATLASVFTSLGIEARVVDRAAGTIGNPRFNPRRIEGRRLSTFFDCGSGLTGDYADTYEVTMMIQVQLSAAAGGGTSVRTTVDAFAADRNSSGSSIHCRPRGSLERRVGELITERLSAT